MKRIPLPHYISRSGASFETSDKFLESSVVVDTTKETLKEAGVPLVHIDDNSYATSIGEMHCFVIGDTGSGKTRRVIMPTIRLLAKAGESMVISDTKGELYKTTADSLIKKGYDVKVLNFRNPGRGDRWNPLAMIDKLYHTPDEEAKDKALMMLSDIVDVLQDNVEGHDPYWSIAAGNVFRGISLMILENGESGSLTFENVAVLAREVHKQVRRSKDKYENNNNGSGLVRFIETLPKGSPIYQNLSVIITNAENTANCIMAEFEAMISLYSGHETLIDLFAESQIDISCLGVKPTALFFILPDDTQALYPIATVFVKQVYSALVSLADEQTDGKLPNRVTFLLDEFANFAKMPSIESMLTAARSRKIRFVLVCQSMDQLTSKYQESGRETLMANCRVWIYMSCRNLPFLKRLEELMGFYVSPYTGEKLPLVDIGQLQHLDMGQILVLNDRCRPMMGYLPDYSEYDFGAEGRGEIVDIPAPHEKIERKHFDINLLYASLYDPNSSAVKKRKEERKKETDGLSASVKEKIRAYQKRKEMEGDDDASGVTDDGTNGSTDDGSGDGGDGGSDGGSGGDSDGGSE